MTELSFYIRHRKREITEPGSQKKQFGNCVKISSTQKTKCKPLIQVSSISCLEIPYHPDIVIQSLTEAYLAKSSPKQAISPANLVSTLGLQCRVGDAKLERNGG